MKHLFTLVLTFLLSMGIAQAQRMQPDPVTPASKGPLPEMPALEEAEEGHFAGLQLLHTTLSPFQGKNWDYEAEFSFPLPQTFGGDSYTLQINRGGGWEAYNEGNTFVGSGYIVYILGCSYRLKLHGGDKDGWVSNEVAVPSITIPSQKKYTQYGGNQETFVGSTLRGSSITIRVYHDHDNFNDYTDFKDDATFKRMWYRRNPNTGKMTYTGAEGSMYTVAPEDVGYEIVEVIEGDNKNTDFYYSLTMGKGKFPIFSSAEFFYEGVIVNTEYDLPNPETLFGFQEWNEENKMNEVQPFAPENFKVLAPGRYAITCPWNRYNWQYLYSTDDILGFCEQAGDYYVEPLYLWAAPGELETKVMKGGNVVEGAKVNLMEKNMEGRMQYVYTSTDGYLISASYITLYAKAVDVGKGYLPTYYPNVLLWTEAQSFDAQEMYHSEMGPQPITIDVRPDFAPLSGQCIIEGEIEATLPSNIPLFYMDEEEGTATGNAEPVYVYLRKKGGDIIAAALMQANGSYKFEKVPYGTYEVIPNIDGIYVDILTVTLSAESNYAKVDFAMNGNTLSSGSVVGISDILATPADDGAIYDLQGRRISNPTRGLYIRNGKKLIVGKGF